MIILKCLIDIDNDDDLTASTGVCSQLDFGKNATLIFFTQVCGSCKY